MGADINGVAVRDDVAIGGMPYRRSAWLPAVRRRALPAAEACCDTAAWICGLLAAAWISTDHHGPGLTVRALWPAVLSVCLLQAGYGLLARLYLGRYQRGSFEEIVAAERDLSTGRMPQRPFVLVAQQYLADPSR